MIPPQSPAAEVDKSPAHSWLVLVLCCMVIYFGTCRFNLEPHLRRWFPLSIRLPAKSKAAAAEVSQSSACGFDDLSWLLAT